MDFVSYVQLAHALKPGEVSCLCKQPIEFDALGLGLDFGFKTLQLGLGLALGREVTVTSGYR